MLGKLQHEQWLVRIAVCGTNLFSVGAHAVRVGGSVTFLQPSLEPCRLPGLGLPRHWQRSHSPESRRALAQRGKCLPVAELAHLFEWSSGSEWLPECAAPVRAMIFVIIMLFLTNVTLGDYSISTKIKLTAQLNLNFHLILNFFSFPSREDNAWLG